MNKYHFRLLYARFGVFKRLLTYYKTHMEAFCYLLFGGLSFLISAGMFELFHGALGIAELTANLFSWTVAVIFSFFTNRKWVFSASTGNQNRLASQFLSFLSGRVVTLFVEEIILLVFITWLFLPALPVKLSAQAIVMILNYIISKCLVFK